MRWFRIAALVLIISMSYAHVRVIAQATIEAVPVLDVDGGCVMGGSLNGAWVKAEEMATRMSGGDKYRVYDLKGEWKSFTGGKPESTGPPCEETMSLKLPDEIRDSILTGSSYVGVAGKWNPMPRSSRIENSKSAVYRNMVAALLKKKGIKRPQVHITKVLRVDLEGDGVDEVIVTATRVSRWGGGSITPNANAGDYSIVMLRKMVNGKIQNIMLDEEYHTKYSQFSAPNEYNLSAVLDLNGDGVMEIIVAGAYYEGNWKTVYSIQGNKVENVMGCGCGA